MNQTYTPEAVTKEQIPELHCSHRDVLKEEIERIARHEAIQKAANLARNFSIKARIVFETAEGIKEVRSVIWAATANHIILKGGATLPTCCVKEVSLE
jgi:hypothetical protein